MRIEDPDYQVGARFEALDEGVLVAASKSTGYFFAISISQKVRWDVCFLRQVMETLSTSAGSDSLVQGGQFLLTPK